jgi:glutamate---cysteine ligase / carboxylate-amine ligase
MGFCFQGSERPTLGVEIELQIIDPETLDLSARSEEILTLCEQQGINRVKAEIHQSMIEIDSEISKDVKQCRAYLKNTLSRLNDLVESLGLKLSITGTHPFQHWADRLISNSDRYQGLHDKYQWLARRMNVYGMHVHIGVHSGDRALAICQEMIPYLPYFLALSANSPYWQGIDTGMQSSRINILDAFPFSGSPHSFRSWDQFEDYCLTLNKVGAIQSFKDLYWYVRPNLFYGTLEVRICDAMTKLDESMALAALIQCLVTKINADLDKGIPSEGSPKHLWIAPENQWIAARDGLSGMIIVDLEGKRQKIADAIEELIKDLSSIAEQLHCQEELRYLNEIIKNGNGAQRQLNAHLKTNSLREIVEASHNEFKMNL